MAEANLMLYAGAVALGALHAFEPGHGKTIIAAYMIGTRGRAIDGLILGLIVTFTHTFSVILLGVIAKLLAGSYTEAQLHGWLGLFSAILILAVGIWMIRERLRSNGGHGHVHLFGHAHGHDHHGHEHHLHHPRAAEHSHHHGHVHDHSHVHSGADHDHGHSHNHGPAGHHCHSPAGSKETRKGQPPPGKWDLLLLGISGGLVPCPAAIATLLAAIAAGRIAEGLTMALFFSLGLGAVMMAIGVTLSQAGRLASRIGENLELGRRIGLVSAVLITLLGCYTLLHSLRTIATL